MEKQEREIKIWPQLKASVDGIDTHLKKSPTALFDCYNPVGGWKYHPTVIRGYVAEGRVYAQQILNAVLHYYAAACRLASYEEEHNDSDAEALIGEFGQCLEIAPFVTQFEDTHKVLIMELVKTKIDEYQNKPGQLDIYARECYAFLKENSPEENVEFLKKCIIKYPQVAYFYQSLASMYGSMKQYPEGLEVAEAALVLFPRSYELLFNKANLAKLAFEETKSSPNQEIQNYLAFLEQAPEGHYKVAEAYYAIASLIMAEQTLSGEFDPQQVEKYYGNGLKSEERLLPCFLPYDSPSKIKVKSFIEIVRGRAEKERPQQNRSLQDDTAGTTKETLLESRLKDPRRVAAVLAHRTMFSQSFVIGKEYVSLLSTTTIPQLEQAAPRILTGLRAITFSEMNNTEDKVYRKRILDVVVVEDPGMNMPSVYVLLEDKNRDVLRGCFYNVKGDPRLKYGAKISLANPYLRFGAFDGKPGIRVDDPKSLIFHEEGCSDRCRYCGERNSKFQCARCARKYCSKKCQTQDWKVLKHKLICFCLA